MNKKLVCLALAMILALCSVSALAANYVNVFNWEDYISEEAIPGMLGQIDLVNWQILQLLSTLCFVIRLRSEPPAGIFDLFCSTSFACSS